MLNMRVEKVALHHSAQRKALAKTAIGQKVKYDYNFDTPVSSVEARLQAFSPSEDCSPAWNALVDDALADEADLTTSKSEHRELHNFSQCSRSISSIQ